MVDRVVSSGRIQARELADAVSAALVSEARELVPAAQAVCRVVAAAFGDTAVLRLVDGPRGVRIVGAAGPSPEIVDDMIRTFTDVEHPSSVDLSWRSGVALRTGFGQPSPESSPQAAAFRERHGFVGSLVAPLNAGGRTIGTLSLLCTHHPEGHDEDDLASLVQAAERCALGIENARLLEKLAHELDERSLIERRHAALLRHSSDVILVVNRKGILLDVTPAVESVLGWRPDDIIRTDLFQIIDEADRITASIGLAAAAEQPGPTLAAELRVRHADGSFRWMEVMGNNLLDDPAVGAIVFTARDVTERHLAGELLAVENRVLQQIASVAPLQEILDSLCLLVESHVRDCIASVWVIEDGDRLVKRASPSVDLREIMGEEELVISAAHIGLLGPKHPEVLVTRIGESSEWAGWEEVGRAAGISGSWSRAVCEPTGEAMGSIVLFFAETGRPTEAQVQVLEMAAHLAGLALTRERAGQAMAHAASHDTLTNLPNRMRFLDRLGRVLTRSGEEGEVAVLFIDLDDFKTVNDTSGHGVGDELLREAAARLAAVVRPMDLIARLGGDEFAVLCDGLDATGAGDVAARVLEVLDQPFELDGRDFHVSASVGIAVGNAGDTPGGVLRDADTAMYVAKRGGRNRYTIFSPAIREATLRRSALEQDLRRAIEAQDLSVHYQPVVSLHTGRLVGLEALARWTSTAHGTVPPLEFVGIAERAGMIVALGTCILRQAVGRAAAWREAGLIDSDVTVAVNVAAQQLVADDFVATVVDALDEVGLPPEALCLELTESAAMADVERTAAALEQLRALGVTLAIDDFGTGHSSLARLRSLEASVLKLDRLFILDLEIDQRSVEVVQSVVQLAHALGKRLVVEGVETAEQLRILQVLGADAVQGFHLARPQAVGAIDAFLRVHRAWELPG